MGLGDHVQGREFGRHPRIGFVTLTLHRCANSRLSLRNDPQLAGVCRNAPERIHARP